MRRCSVLYLIILVLGLVSVPAAQTPKRSLLQEDVSLVNCNQYGSALNDVTLNACIAGVGSQTRTAFLANGTWVLAANVTVPANLTLWIPAGTAIVLAPGVTLTLATPPLYDRPDFLTGAGTLRITDASWPIDPRLYGAKGDGTTDDTHALTEALAALPTGGGAILLPCGTYPITSTLSLVNRTNVKLLGLTVARGAGDSQCVTLQYTAASGALLNVDGTVGFELGGINLTYTHASYAGTVLSLAKVAGAQSTTRVHLHDCTIQGTTTSSKGATALVAMNFTAQVVIERCLFENALVGIQGSNAAAVNVPAVTIRDNTFGSGLSTRSIEMGGIAWTITHNYFLPTTSLVGHAFGTLGPGALGLTYHGNYHNTAASNSTRWFDVSGGAIQGASIRGNVFLDSTANGYCLVLTSSSGVEVGGNYFFCGKAIYAGGTEDIALLPNYYGGGGTPIETYPAGNSLVMEESSTGLGATRMQNLTTTGAAAGKRVVCVDPATGGRLYTSSTGVDCSN